MQREKRRRERANVSFLNFCSRERRGGFSPPANTSFPCGRTCGLFLVKGRISFEYYLASMVPLSLRIFHYPLKVR